MKYSLSISGIHYSQLRAHLFPGDDKEAVALALCGTNNNDCEIKLLVHEIYSIPYQVCKREEDMIKWPTEYVIPALKNANKHNFSVVKFHSHPGGFANFSDQDDRSDGELFPSLFGWIDNAKFHMSCIMLPNGEIFGRVFDGNLKTFPIDKISCIGDNITYWRKRRIVNGQKTKVQDHQVFGRGTVSTMKSLKIAVIGCSGTGSPIIEQLVRLRVGEIILIDPDIVLKKNVNRILNSTMTHASGRKKKVDVLKDAGERVGFGTIIKAFPQDLFSDVALIKEVANCDFIFGCVDKIDARHLLNQISAFYLIPYIDLGVFLKSDGFGGLEYIAGTVHYIQPGGSSLMSRGVYTPEELRAIIMKKMNPKLYSKQHKSKYITDVKVESPAVISVNMQLSALAVNEFLIRMHNLRKEESENFAIIRTDILNSYIVHEKDGEADEYLSKYTGRGDNISPFLNMVEFSNPTST